MYNKSIKDCLFCKIIKDEIPSFKIWEDENHLAFLTIHPIKEGHTLVIPKTHSPYLFEMDDQSLQNLIVAAKKVSGILKKVFVPKSGKVGVLVLGLEINHAHIHLVPLDKEGELNLAKARLASNIGLTAVLERIKRF